MYKINLDLPLLNLDDSKINVEGASTLAVFLSDILSVKADGMNVIEAFDFARSLKQKGYMQVTSEHIKQINEVIKSNQQLAVLVKAQLLKAIEQQKEEQDKAEKNAASV